LKPQWFETFFGGLAVEAWVRATTPEMTNTEADFLEKVLELKSGARLLDVPCGHGRHALELARRGYRVTGIDLSTDALDVARQHSSTVEWVRSDMREIVSDSEFDAAYCFGNSFAYLDSSNARAFLRSLARALRPGGRLAIDTGMTAESILPTRQQRRWFRLGDILMLSENRYVVEESRLDIDYTFVRDGVIQTHPSSSYVFTAAELRRMLDDAGFSTIAMFRSTLEEPFEFGSPRLILTARKR